MTSESGEVWESVGAKRICPYPHLVAFLQLYPIPVAVHGRSELSRLDLQY